MADTALHRAFQERFKQEPELYARAPGRVNLIGEHTDYSGGFVFPVAIDRSLYIAAARAEGSSELSSLELGDGESFDARSVEPDDIEDWAAYGAGMAWALRELGIASLSNLRAIVRSDVPIGSGVSSSAAIELAFGVIWNELDQLGLSRVELAKVGQRCENGFVGVNSGIMDQMASACGRRGHAMFLDTRSLDIEYAPIPEQLRIVLCDTGKPRALTDSAYNERREQCEAAARILGVPMLRDADPRMVEGARDRLDQVVYHRARHVTTENERCIQFKSSLHKGDFDMLGRLMQESHESLRDDFEVSSPELDAMAEAAWDSPGCVGARMTGAGFGGACVALVEADYTDQFVAAISDKYTKTAGLAGDYIVCFAVDGASVENNVA